jgi:hypothetical protein
LRFSGDVVVPVKELGKSDMAAMIAAAPVG